MSGIFVSETDKLQMNSFFDRSPISDELSKNRRDAGQHRLKQRAAGPAEPTPRN
jgi:hypothetical protein